MTTATPPKRQDRGLLVHNFGRGRRREVERWKTFRLAIRGGWGMTLRLLALIAAPPALLLLAAAAARALLWG